MIKVSIVVPVYNVEIYLEKCLESLVNQTLEDIEIIVVNDGSSDGSQEIIEKYASDYPKKIIPVWKEKKSAGPSDARNLGMSYCKGEYIGFIDADDYVERIMYEKLYDRAKEEDCDIVICDYIKEYTSIQETVKARQYQSRKDMFIGGLAVPWNKIYKREWIERINVRFPGGMIYEDTEFFCCLIPYVERCGYVDIPLIHYVQRRSSLSNRQGDRTAMIFMIFDRVISYYRQNGWYEAYQQELEYFVVRVLFGSSMERIGRCSDAELRKELLYRTWDYSIERFPGWKKNSYMKGLSEKRNLYMKVINRGNIVFLSSVLRRYSIYKEKKLFK